MPLKRLKKKIMTENIWIYILKMLSEKSMYAYEIQKEIGERFNFSIGKITAYVVLYKLERSGYVKTQWIEKRRRQRKYYKITNKGKDLLLEGIKFLDDLIERIRG